MITPRRPFVSNQNLVYDVDSLTWVAMEQPSTGAIPDPGPTYDSGIVTLTDTIAALTTDTIQAASLLLCNLTTSAQAVTVTDTAGNYYLKDFPLQGKMTIVLALGAMSLVGVKWKAGANLAVNALLVGQGA